MEPKKRALGLIALNTAIGIFLLFLLIGGGSSRADVGTLLFVRLSAVLLIGFLLLGTYPEAGTFLRLPLLFVGAVLALMVVELIPLPPAVWQSLPGRAFYAQAASLAGLGQPWRPITVSPDMTIEALLGWLPALAIVILFTLGPPRVRRDALYVLIWIVMISAVLAVFQQSGGEDSPLRFYRYTNPDAGVGLLANRNHQALLMAMGIPLAAWWAARPGQVFRSPPLRFAVAAGIVFVCLIGALLTESRTGIALCAVAAVGAIAIIWPVLARFRRAARWSLLGAAAAAAVTGFLLLPIDRLGISLVVDDARTARIWPTTAAALREFFPLGSGFGTFERVYPRFERLANLRPEYANKAHSDLLELGLEAGLLGYIAAAVFLGWFAWASFRLWRARLGAAQGMLTARTASVLIALGVIASMTDYPLRTPLMGCLFTAAVLLLYWGVVELKAARARRGHGNLAPE